MNFATTWLRVEKSSMALMVTGVMLTVNGASPTLTIVSPADVALLPPASLMVTVTG